MLRRWAQGLLALIFVLGLVQGSVSLAPLAGSVRDIDKSLSAADHSLQPITQSLQKTLETPAARSDAQGKRDREREVGGGDDKLGVVLAALLIFVGALLPARERSPITRFGFADAHPASRPWTAGRCPTGPPALTA